ncbi:SDR family NAD(P)-dependent oxidoreductase [Kibdelosporangium philippinense]|uniref:SDR family NAD(P)-dependent oxidoreductase n=1 Tax=Kibdelosporangium philippinense TaxID=211113 RepID=A0ABS8Z3N1_9PSEU|nr:SDR family NAD(P)-dependent oxidoreductase [Kibdelosporangium philippinense]MCE7002528.1 SDR family NAD(P)-dependent oxidoreductase [Kibdelosporangium philippinense]
MPDKAGLADDEPLVRVRLPYGGQAWLARRYDDVGRNCDLIKIMVSDLFSPYRSQYGFRELSTVVAEAHDWGLPVVAYTHNRQAVLDAAAAGVDSMTHVTYGGITEDPPLVKQLVAKGVPLAFGSASGIRPPGTLPHLPSQAVDVLGITPIDALVGVTSAAADAMVNVHSLTAWLSGIPGSGTYGAAKAALISFTNSLRSELGPQGVQVLGVQLGWTDTDLVKQVDDAKNDPAVVAADIVAALHKGEAELIADDASRHFKGALSGPVEALDLSR